METVIEGRWKRQGGARLHVAPEGITLVDPAGGVVGSAAYEDLTGVSAGKDGRRSLLRVELGERGTWVLDGLHPLQARFAAELIQEQLSALHRRTLPMFAHAQPLANLGRDAESLLATSQRG